jgi:class 3 adenylate cyclase
MGTQAHAPVRTFLIADIRGYTRFTEEYGDEASARLSAKFSDLVHEGAQLRGGTLMEIRGDEALVIFESARQAIRAATDLQRMFSEETDADSDLAMNVGIGIDSGEAIALEDGSVRGAALNIAARLCAMAHGGEVIVSEGTSHLAGRLPGLRFVDRGRAHLKGIADPVRVIRVAPEDESQNQPRILMFFASPKRLSWSVGLGVMLIAAATAVAVVYLTGGNTGEPSTAVPGRELPGSAADARRAGGPRPHPGRLEQALRKASRRRRRRGGDRRLRPARERRNRLLARPVGGVHLSERSGRPSGLRSGTPPAPARNRPGHVQPAHVGRRGALVTRSGEARRAQALLLRSERRRHRLDPRTPGASEP